jgi:hypothetical protein
MAKPPFRYHISKSLTPRAGSGKHKLVTLRIGLSRVLKEHDE